MKRPLHERARELAGIPLNESTSKNLERVLNKLMKKGVMRQGDVQHVLDNVWAAEPRSVRDMDDFLNGDAAPDEEQFPADEIFKAYVRDVKASGRRPR